MSRVSNKIKPRTLPGFMELLPAEQVLFNKMMDIIRASYEKFGFVPLDTPLIESSEILLAKAGGETEKQIYRFTKGESDLSLRFDLTVPLAKYVSLNFNSLTFPFRRYQIGKVFRGERPQKGRFREFYQCDIDIIGDGELGIMNDAEIPSIIYETFKNLGFENFTIRINNRKILNGFFRAIGLSELAGDVLRIIDKIDKIGEDNVRKELENIAIDKKAIDFILSFVSIKGSCAEIILELKKLNIQEEVFVKGLDEIEQVVKGIADFGVPSKNYKIDLTIARGLDYYTGTVYETILDEYPGIGSVCSGGRYDNLAEFYTDKKLPGVGISIGFTRLFYQLLTAGIVKPANASTAKAIVMPMIDDISIPIKVASDLRRKGINTEVYYNNKPFKKKMSYANNLGIEYVIIIGEDELQANEVSVKNMITGEQKRIPMDKVYEAIA